MATLCIVQVFNTLTEVIQGPCVGNQQTLAHSRLWDAVGGFLFLFAHMQDKLSKHSSQVDLLKELLNLQKDMVIMMLSMLEGESFKTTSRDVLFLSICVRVDITQLITDNTLPCRERGERHHR